jgi:CHAT domain-containing protein
LDRSEHAAPVNAGTRADTLAETSQGRRRRWWWSLAGVVLAAGIASLRLSSSHKDTPQQLLADADQFAWLYNWPKAGPLYEEAEKRFVQADDKRGAMAANLGLIRAQIDSGSLPNLSGELEADLQNPLVRSDRNLLLRCLVTKAAVDQEMNEASAEDLWKQILGVAKELGEKRWEARAQAELGIIAFLAGDVTQSTTMIKAGLTEMLLHRDLAGEVMYGSVVGNGLVEMGEPREGLGYCEILLGIAASTKDMGFPFPAYLGKARALVALGREAEARRLLEQTLVQTKTLNARLEQVDVLIALGKQSWAAKHPQEAMTYFEQASELSRTGNFHHTLAWSLYELGKAEQETGQLDQAEETMRSALETMREVEDKYHLPLHLALLAEIKAEKGQWREAQALFSNAADVVDGMLVDVPSPRAESYLISTLGDVYSGSFELAAKHNETDFAYEMIERARGRSIADILRNRSPKPEPEAEPAAARQVSELQIELLHAESPSDRRQLLDRLFEAEQLLTPGGIPRTGLQAAALGNKPIDLVQVRSELRRDEMILEYVLEDPTSFCISITREQANVTPLPAGRKQIEDLVETYLNDVKSDKTAHDDAAQLYAVLLQPMFGKEEKARLVIVPDGALNGLPFDALIDSHGDYVLTSHVVTYAPSVTVLHLLRNVKRAPQTVVAYLGVGGVTYQASTSESVVYRRAAALNPANGPDGLFGLTLDKLRNLPGSREEVLSAAAALGAPGTLLLGQQATEAAFKSEPLGSFAVIHMAVHAVASEKFPDRSALILESDASGTEDGLLQVREIRELRLNADLVTLSACDTGRGEINGEDGIANLVRAFLLAGSKTVLASLWNASDDYTPALMKRFYEHVGAGEDEGTALQQAKMDVIKEFGDSALPVYWAGFTITGDAAGPLSALSRRGSFRNLTSRPAGNTSNPIPVAELPTDKFRTEGP